MTWFYIALLSSFLSAFSTIGEKKVLLNIGALKFSFLLSITNLLFSLPFFFTIDYSAINGYNISILFIKSVLGVAAFLCVMTSIKNLELSKALPLLALTPGFVAVFAFLFLGEELRSTEIIGLLLLVVGTYILESKKLKEVLSPFSVFVKSRYHHYVVFALLLFTASSILDKVLLVKLNFTPTSLIAFQHFFFAFLFLAVFIFFRDKNEPGLLNVRKNDLILIVVISILTIGYRYTQIVAVSMASVALTLAVKRTSVFWATIIGGKIFKETNLLKKTISVLLIVIGTILILR